MNILSFSCFSSFRYLIGTLMGIVDVDSELFLKENESILFGID